MEVYRHNHPGTSKPFFPEFSSPLDSVSAIYSNRFLIVGDFNYWVDDSTNLNSSRFLSLLTAHDLVSNITSPTHISGHTLDLVLSPSRNLPTDLPFPNTVVFPPDNSFSDHSFLLITLSFTVALSKSPRRFSFRSFKNFNPIYFSTLISGLLPLSIFHFLEPSELYPYFSNALSSINDHIFPLISVSERCRTRPPWFNAHLSFLKTNQRRDERLWRRSLSDSDWSSFCSSRRLYLSTLSAAKSSYYKSRLSSLSKSSKNLWGTLKSLTGLNSSKSSCSISPSKFADFFSSKVKKCRANIPTTKTELKYTLSSKSFPHFNHVHLQDVLLLLSKTKKSFSVSDPINFSATSDSISLLAPFFLHIINCSLLHGVFLPEKHAIVHPILKKIYTRSLNLQ